MSTDPTSDVNPLQIPYWVHTNRELELMLAGIKPLAHFYDAYPPHPCEEIIPLEAFSPFVEAGRFATRQYVELLQAPPPNGHANVRGILHVFFARASEEWRIDAYILLQSVSAKTGWSEGFERFEGALLGYEEWQSDLHMASLRESPMTRDCHWLRSR